jgi:hypothetical protein
MEFFTWVQNYIVLTLKYNKYILIISTERGWNYDFKYRY